MKMAIVVPEFNAGGVETFILRLASFMKKGGHEVTLISTHEKGEWWGRLSNYELESECLSKTKSLSPVTHMVKIGKYIKNKSFDIVILNNERYTQASLNMLPDKINAIPIIHNDAEFAYEIGCANLSAWNVIVGVSPKVCYKIKTTVGARPVVEIPYGVETPGEELLQRHRKFDKHLKLLFVGRIEHVQKGVLFLPDVVAGCLKNGLDVSLTIVGDGSDLGKLRNKINRIGLWNNVSFLGLLPHEEVYDVLLSHHILLLPSFFEGLAIIALESQACGCVPVASKLQGITDRAIEDGTTGILVQPGNIDELIKAITDLNRCPEKWAAMSMEGHSRVERMFSVESMGQSYLRLFHDVIHGCYPLPYSRRKYYPVSLSLLKWRDFVPNYLRKIKRIILESHRID